VQLCKSPCLTEPRERAKSNKFDWVLLAARFFRVHFPPVLLEVDLELRAAALASLPYHFLKQQVDFQQSADFKQKSSFVQAMLVAMLL
jgi:hypothetical protein